VKVIGPSQQREELFCSMISKGSLFLETRRPYQVGDEIFLAFNLPTGQSIQTWGMVRSIKTDKFATIDSPAGMEIFFSLKDESKKALDLLLGD
jgi:Tfp pilus assembly protein PilZ